MAKVEGVQRATGRAREEWFALLDRWGAPGREYREIAAWLTDRHGLSSWWAQKVIVEYEQDRGLRQPGARPNGTFEVGASKTVRVPVDRLFDAFVNSRIRRKWLTDGSMKLRTSTELRTARFDWEDGVTRVNAFFTKKGPAKSSVAVTHERIPSATAAQKTKSTWKQRMADLQAFLEH